MYKKDAENSEKNDKQTWSKFKQKIANISSVNECHKIDTSFEAGKTVAKTAPTIKKKMNNAWPWTTAWVTRQSEAQRKLPNVSKRGKGVSRERRHAACCLFSRGVIFTPARVSLALLSLRKNGGLLVV